MTNRINDEETGSAVIASGGAAGALVLLILFGITAKRNNEYITERPSIKHRVETVYISKTENGSHLEARFFDNGILRTAYEGGVYDRISEIRDSPNITAPEITLDSELTQKVDPDNKIIFYTLKLPQGYLLDKE